jgi:hypothetical protein
MTKRLNFFLSFGAPGRRFQIEIPIVRAKPAVNQFKAVGIFEYPSIVSSGRSDSAVSSL